MINANHKEAPCIYMGQAITKVRTYWVFVTFLVDIVIFGILIFLCYRWTHCLFYDQ